ncbi:aldehyde dehydrogenase family protein [Mycolicibacterium holsaticum]|uniref:aldehyde dehydrogenase family protein n=1 Tax=Mycolicibacterium holsaticum TaxID=152142 RepID=UPI001C7D82E0|nr:aldehyde dehydrogenase family protein [Mycolicibacterium holsaticum]QZA12745.1 aldehyde dehydrogenase family protein [Mycolicibacterium holsaticum DSM 44478 = JCM 12374]UNC09781.1 aldehyde dehydrogenase family protein [Mycolicibacterium holsaticum DSM 44478 = JCM 12374]
MSAQATAATRTEARHTRIEVVSPATGRVVGVVPVNSREDVAATAAELRAAQPEWEARGPGGRKVVLRRFLDWILDNEQSLVETIQAESGKSWGDASLEIIMAVDTINYYVKNVSKFMADRTVSPAGLANLTKKLTVQYRPYPLVGVITPWNGPLAGPIMDGVAALLAGAAVAFKPSEVTPLTWSAAARGWRDIGAPTVLACVNGYGDVGQAVVDEVDMVMFTGSTATGRAIATRAGERLIPCSLELGGKDAMIVCADANLPRAAKAAAWGAMFNSGQICVSVERAYVVADVYDRFVDLVASEVGALRHGTDAPGSFSSDVGAMATAAQLDTVERHVADAVAKGAHVLIGGHRREPGLYFEPTVLTDVDHSMLCMREETFGPTLPIMKVDTEDHAVELANDCVYGLGSSIWTRDHSRAHRLSRRIEAGAVNINNALATTFQMTTPMSGWKQSGLGQRFDGAAGMLKFCRPKTVLSERIELPSEPLWYPYRRRVSTSIARLVRLTGAHDWRRRLTTRTKEGST